MPVNDTLWKRLESAKPSAVQKIADIMGVTTAGKQPGELVETLSMSIRSAAGHSLVNLFRNSHEFPYKQMLIDVADKIAPGWTFLSWTGYSLNDKHGEIEIEEKIYKYYEEMLQTRIASLTAEQKDKLKKDVEKELLKDGYKQVVVTQVGNSLMGGAVASLIATPLAYMIALNTSSGFAWLSLYWTGHAATSLVWFTFSGTTLVLCGPLLLWWAGDTAYRKTIPVTMQLINIRKMQEIENTLANGNESIHK